MESNLPPWYCVCQSEDQIIRLSKRLLEATAKAPTPVLSTSITVNASVAQVTVLFLRRSKFGKTKWLDFCEDLERNIVHRPVGSKFYDNIPKLAHQVCPREYLKKWLHLIYFGPSCTYYQTIWTAPSFLWIRWLCWKYRRTGWEIQDISVRIPVLALVTNSIVSGQIRNSGGENRNHRK